MYLVTPGLVATPLQQALFYSDGAGLQRGVRELEVRLRRRARALRALGRATTGAPVRLAAHCSHAQRALRLCRNRARAVQHQLYVSTAAVAAAALPVAARMGDQPAHTHGARLVSRRRNASLDSVRSHNMCAVIVRTVIYIVLMSRASEIVEATVSACMNVDL